MIEIEDDDFEDAAGPFRPDGADAAKAMARGTVAAFNANRRATIRRPLVLTVDESMSAYRPRTTATGGLPNISYVARKPKPLGTEFKNCADGETGILMRRGRTAAILQMIQLFR